jgi:diguanylate cyclase (GGDEF)-like protein
MGEKINEEVVPDSFTKKFIDDVDPDTAEKWRTVDKLREDDNHREDSIITLAEEEDDYRKKYERLKNDQDYERLANDNSEKNIKIVEATKQAMTDGLTGLRSRKWLLEEAHQLLSLEKRQEKDCALLMIDLDDFKIVNDQFGHPAGDEVLKKIAELIKHQVRASDTVCRFGGEEIVVFFPDTISGNAAVVAEKLRQEVEDLKIEIEDKSGKKINLAKTISIGCAGTDQLPAWKEYNEVVAKEFLDSLIKAADTAMYDSKQAGKNRVTIYKNKERAE